MLDRDHYGKAQGSGSRGGAGDLSATYLEGVVLRPQTRTAALR